MKTKLNSEIKKEVFVKEGVGAAMALATKGVAPSSNASKSTKTAFTKNFQVSKNGKSISVKPTASKKVKSKYK